MNKKIALGLIALVLVVGIGYAVNNASKEHIGGNVLHLPWILSTKETTPIIMSPWVNNGLVPHLLFRTLMTPDQSLVANFKPDLASKIEILEDGLLYRVHFKEGSKWSDGVDITLDDVIYSIQTVTKVARTNLIYNHFKGIESIEANGSTLDIRLTERSAMMLPALAQIAILPKHAIKNIPIEKFNAAEFWTNPISSGMFKVGGLTENRAELVLNELYTGKKPKIESVFLHLVNSKNASNAKLDYYYSNDLSEMLAFRAMRSYEEYTIDMYFYRYLVFNLVGPSAGTDDVMKDIRVRQAICMSLDRTKLLHDVYMNVGNVVNGAGVTNAFGPYNYNPTKAKELLAQAKYDFNRPLVFGYYSTDVTSQNFMAAAAKQLEDIGFKVELLVLPDAESLFNTRAYDFYLKGYGATQPYEWFNEYLSTNAFFTNLFQHTGQFDDLVSQVAAESDQVKHNVLLSELVSLEQGTLYKFPLFTLGQSVYINSDRLQLPRNFKHGNYFYAQQFGFEDWEIKKK